MSSTAPAYLRIKPSEMEVVYYNILIKNGFVPDKARTTAQVFTSNSLDGVYTHSVNRFPKFVQYVQQGFVKPDKEAVLKSSVGCIEQWDGQAGVGVLNALQCTDRAMAHPGIGSCHNPGRNAGSLKHEPPLTTSRPRPPSGRLVVSNNRR